MMSEHLHSYSKPKQYIRVYLALAMVSLPVAYLLTSVIIPSIEKYIGISLWFLDLPSVLGIYSAFYEIFDRCVWRLPFVKKILNIADLNGVWRGSLKSSYDSFENEYYVEYTISQRFTKMSIYNEGEKSVSSSTMAAMYNNNSKYTTLKFEYMNTPNAKETEQLKIHYGVNTLLIQDDEKQLKGRYYTDENRCTYGEMVLNKV